MTQYIYTTPGTRVRWSNVAEWCAAAWTLDRRRWSRKARRDLETHAVCMPLAMIKIENDLEAIEEAVKLLKYGPTGLQRPQRGHRGDHPTTAIIVALNNRAAVLKRAADNIPQCEQTVDQKIAAAKVQGPEPRRTIGSLVQELLMDPDLGYLAIVDRVKTDFPDANTSVRSVASVAAVLRKKGVDVPLRRTAKAQ